MVELKRGEIMGRVYAVMERAYMESSMEDTIPAPARAMGYAARRLSKLGDDLDLAYFLDKLLDRYLEQHPEDAERWDIVRDPRGTFHEPDGGAVELGTIAVRNFLSHVGRYEPPSYDDVEVDIPQLRLGYPTRGPGDQYAAVVYIEKEGFADAIRRAGIANRFGVAIASCKGFSVKAARRLVRQLADQYGVTVLVAHDFDKAGFGIAGTLGDGFIDLGLRWADLPTGDEPAIALMSEPTSYDGDPRPNLRLHGATEEEIAYLCPPQEPEAFFRRRAGRDHVRHRYHGRRVELNALVGQAFIDWLERKLDEHGIAKVIPDEDVLAAAYRYAARRSLLNDAVERAFDEVREEVMATEIEVPDDLVGRLTNWWTEAGLEQLRRRRSWDDAIVALVREDQEEEK
jgi:hypothetical protein